VAPYLQLQCPTDIRTEILPGRCRSAAGQQGGWVEKEIRGKSRKSSTRLNLKGELIAMIRRFVQNAGALVLLGVFASGVSAQEEAKPKAIPHDTEGRAECLTCHSGAVEGIKGAP
jgi:hypothetical protein